MRRTAALLFALLVAAQVNLSALVPAAAGKGPPPWWVGGGLLWPFFTDTDTLRPVGGFRDALTPILGVTAAVCFLLAACALQGWVVPASWTSPLVVGGAVLSIVLQAMWLSGWAILPLVVDIVLLRSVFARRLPVDSLRGRTVRSS